MKELLRKASAMDNRDIFNPEEFLKEEYWEKLLQDSEDREKDWRGNADQIEEIYRGEVQSLSYFNILYSNTNTLKASVYARNAKPEITRRYGDPDKVSRTISTILERVINYSSDEYRFFENASSCVLDYLLGGRGVQFVCYDVEMGKETEVQIVGGFDELTGEATAEEVEVDRDYIAKQSVKAEFVYWRDFLMSDGRVWSDIWWLARRHYLTETQVGELLGADNIVEEGQDKTIAESLNYTTITNETDKEGNAEEGYAREEVWEIWCKPTKQRIYLARGTKKIILVDDDPYKLNNFFPVAEPMTANRISKDLLPFSFYDSYREQARELNDISLRITNLVDSIKRYGGYDASVADEAKKLENADDNTFVAIAGMKEKGGIDTYFSEIDITPISNVVANLNLQRDNLIQSIYEISGISDIIRGQGNPNETATAQKIKGQFAGMRLRDMQSAVQRNIRDTFEIMSEIIAEHFAPDQLAKITNMQLPEEAWAIIMKQLRNENVMSYKIDVESDSTAFDDREEEKVSINEFIMTVSNMLMQASQIIQQAPEMGMVYSEMIGKAARAYKVGRQFEDTLQATFQASIQRIQQQSGINPEMIKMQVEGEKLKLEGRKVALDEKKAEADFGLQKTDRIIDSAKLPLDAAKGLPVPQEPQIPLQ